MNKAQNGNVVKVHYTGKFENGDVFDASAENQPLEFKIGAGMVIAGFDKAVLGMAVGETKTAFIPCEEGYGVRQEEMVFNIERQMLPPDIDLAVGQQLQLSHPQGKFWVNVVNFDDKVVTLDANHPLAGKNLCFDLKLMEIV